MRNNETGEFELVMGNRQLLSGFFIVCLLFGVAFAMGYIVGRNSSPTGKTVADLPAPNPAPVVSDVKPPAGGEPQPQPQAPPTGEVPPPDSSAQAGAQPNGSAQAPASQPAPQASAPAATPPAPTPAPAASAPAPSASGVVKEPPSGSYWQVMAVRQSVAEAQLKTLKEKGFPVILAEGTKNLTRVLVGPYKDRNSLGKAKTDLENVGYHPSRLTQ